MVSSGGICEIVEANDEPSTSRRLQTFNQVKGQDREKRPPIVRKAPNKSSHDDINKLFESVNLRATKSLDLSDSWRNASKRPMRGTGSQSPGIGFSEPVTLKQALRGMCISQAAEVAVVKRLSMTSASPSPRISEVGKITNLHRTEKSLMTEESTSYDSEAFSWRHQDSVKKSATQSSKPPPSFSCKSNLKNIKCIPSESGCEDNVGMSRVEGKHFQEPAIKSPKQNPAALVIWDVEPSPSQSDAAPAVKVDLETVCSDTTCQNVSKPEKKNPGSHRMASCPGKNYVTVHKTAPKVRRKSRLQTVTSAGTVKSGKDNKSTKSTSRAVKPATRNKNLLVKKSKKVAASVDDNHNVPHEGSGLGQSQLICQRCQCSLMDTEDDSNKSLSATTIAEVLTDGRKSDSSKPVSIPVVETNINSKSCEKGDISQSSKSSTFDFSSSTTSLSEDSNLSGSTFGNRPHMSKDMRWGAISRIRKQHSFLGLSHFNLLKKIGSGDIGTVYLAELIGTHCLYAIKVMDNEFLARRKKMPRAQTEREILRMLDHPFLPTLYAQFTSDNLSCLVMEFCPGGDLHVLRQKQPGRYFPEEAARFYVAEVLLALEYLHMLGIVYRDLKPENILVREDGHIMLTDFDLSLRCSVNPMLVKSSSLMTEPPRVSGPCAGSNCIDPFCTGPSCKMSCFTPRLFPARKLKADAAAQARSLHHLVAEPTEARSNSFVGTHEYLAPEIIKGEGHGSAVDWWTFGVFLYELLYGKTPFKGAGNEETLGNAVLQNLKFPDTPIVSFQARDLIRGLLAKDPLNRLGTQTGAAEIKRHSFFEGLNWALIRCAVPPQIPEFYEVVDSQMGESQEKLNFVECSGDGEHLEFQLF